MTTDNFDRAKKIQAELTDINILEADLERASYPFEFTFNTKSSSVVVNDRCISKDTRLLLRNAMIEALHNRRDELKEEFEKL